MHPTPSSADNHKKSAEGSNNPEYERMSLAAKNYIKQNMKQNREAAKIYQEMLPQVHEFMEYAKVDPVVFKCMDGRTQTNDHKGIPPTVAINRRSQGGKAELTVGNRELWDVIHKERLRADSDGSSLLVIAAAHRSDLSGGCAAFKQEEDGLAKNPAAKREIDRRALNYMHEQAHRLRFELDKHETKKSPAVLSGITNTDSGAMQLYGKDRKLIFDAEDVILKEEIKEPADVFDPQFFSRPIAEDWAHASIRGKTVPEILNGVDGIYFSKMDVKIAFEAYLMRRISEGGKMGAGIVRPDILTRLHANIDEFNDDVKAFLTYLMVANVAHSTHYRNVNIQLNNGRDPIAMQGQDLTPELQARVNHGERKMAYSLTGHDLETPNSLLLIKPGSGNEEQTVAVGRDVLKGNLEHLGLKDKLPPIVHINIERDKPIETWEDLLEVEARMDTKVAIIEKVFGEDVRIFTTYSYNQIVPTGEAGVCRVKQFMPLNGDPKNPKILIDSAEDIGHGITKANFDKAVIRARENIYTFQDGDEHASVEPHKHSPDSVLTLVA